MAFLLDKMVKVPINSVQLYPDNPRKGDVSAIAESLDANGQFQPLVVQKSTNFILAGNHTHQAAVSLGWEEIYVVFVDVDDVGALKIVLVANKTSDLGSYDELMLVTLLGELREADEELLVGTGYNPDEVDALLADALAFMPEFEETGEESRFAARLLDRIMPPTLAEEITAEAEATQNILEGLEKAGPIPKAVLPPPSEYVLFRFGELRAKVERPKYESFIKAFLKSHGNNLSEAGVAAALLLGLDEDAVAPAVAEGAERWM